MNTYPSLAIKSKMCEPNRSGSEKRRRCGEKSPLQAHSLDQILGNVPSLDVVSISLADPAQEMDGVGVTQIPVECLEHVSLHLENLVLSVSIFGMVKKLCDRRCDDLLKLRSDKEAGEPHQLEFGQGYNVNGEEAVNSVDGEEKSLRDQMEM